MVKGEKKNKKTKNDGQHTTQTTKDRASRISLNTETFEEKI